MLIAQISDCHIVEPGAVVADRIDPVPALRSALASLARFEVDLIVATGDLVNDGRPAQYDVLMEVLADASAPVIPLPGNHDDRGELRRRFAAVLPPGGPDDPIDHVHDIGELRLVFLDTQIPGSNPGAFRPAQAEWLERRLSDDPDRPTIVFQHHPPFATGVRFMDRDAFTGGDLEAEVIRRHPQVELVSCGHIHRLVQRRFAGTVAGTWPATSVTIDLELVEPQVAYTTEPPGFALHHWEADDGLRSHWHPSGVFESWTPAWAL